MAAFSYDYNNYETTMTDTSHYFTPAGWEAYKDALTARKILIPSSKKSLRERGAER